MKMPGFSLAACVLLGPAILAGCLMPASFRKPKLYRVTGRVVDGQTQQGLAYAKLLLRATFPTDVVTQTLANYGVAAADGTYDVELSEGVETVRRARAIRLEISRPGYLPMTVDIPVPTGKESVFKMPDITLSRGDLPMPSPPAIPGLAPSPRTRPLPWQR